MNKPTTKTTKTLFQHGNSQAVELPDGFLRPGQEVEITQQGKKLVLQPVAIAKKIDWPKFWTDFDNLGSIDGFMEDRNQGLLTPLTPKID